MAEYFNKKELMELPQVYDSGLRFIEVDYIEKVGTIDIVHCSECKYAEPHEYFDLARNEKIYGVGCRRSGQHPADWFCADGERKE